MGHDEREGWDSSGTLLVHIDLAEGEAVVNSRGGGRVRGQWGELTRSDRSCDDRPHRENTAATFLALGQALS